MLKKYWWAMAAILLSLPSCLDGDPSRYSFSDLGVIQYNSQDSTIWWFMRDDSTTFVSASPANPPKDMSRVQAYMSWTEGTTRSGYDFAVDFTGFISIITNPVTATSQKYIADTAPNDNITVRNAYTSLQYLNINITTPGYDSKKHKVYLFRDSTQRVEPIKLVLRHSDGGDQPYDELAGIISFDLETLAERNTRDSIRIQLIAPNNVSLNLTYKFHK